MGSATLLSTYVENRVVGRDEDSDFVKTLSMLRSFREEYFKKADALGRQYALLQTRNSAIENYVRGAFQDSRETFSTDRAMEILKFQDQQLTDTNKELLYLQSSLNESNRMIDVVTICMSKLLNEGYYSPILCNSGDSDCATHIKPLPDQERYWSPSKEQKNLILKIIVPPSGKTKSLSFTLSYMTAVGTALWYPQYDIRVEGDMNEDRKYEIEIDFFGVVHQSTGREKEKTTNYMRTRGLLFCRIYFRSESIYILVYYCLSTLSLLFCE